MGVFSVFRKKTAFTEMVCRSEQSKYENLTRALRESLSNGRVAVIVYHFRNNRETAIDLLSQHNIPYLEQTNAYWLSELSAARTEVQIVKSSDLLKYNEGNPSEPTLTADIHLMEHHPLFAKDDTVLSLQNHSSLRFQFIAWSSLDEPLMRMFGGERITAMMDTLGLAENEIITHPFVAKALRNAQEKIAKKANGDSECRSSEEWLRMHVHSI